MSINSLLVPNQLTIHAQEVNSNVIVNSSGIFSATVNAASLESVSLKMIGTESGNFIEITAPPTQPTTYSIQLPATPPAVNQVLTCVSVSPYILQWLPINP